MSGAYKATMHYTEIFESTADFIHAELDPVNLSTIWPLAWSGKGQLLKDWLLLNTSYNKLYISCM
jgi:hypothetical protein